MKRADPPVYLDHNATTRPDARVVDAVVRALDTVWANPSSVHRAGQDARHAVELARESVAGLIGCRPGELIITSGGTESVNLALQGSFHRWQGKRDIIVTTPVEHSAVRQTAELLAERHGAHVIWLPVDADGVVEPEHVSDVLTEHGTRIACVSIQAANNETGVIQPIADQVRVMREHGDRGIAFHCDATQIVGKAPVDVTRMDVDLLSFSPHKFHGPKGIGFLYVKSGRRLAPILAGGSQERSRRGGTENVPGMLGAGVACDLAAERLSRWYDGQGAATAEHPQQVKARFERLLTQTISPCTINGAEARYGRTWTTSNVAFPCLEAEAILLLLSEGGVYASAGAACSSGSLEPSPVLRAMGLPEKLAHGSVRFSFSHETEMVEIERAVAVIGDVINRLSTTLPIQK